ncbi:MAG: LacI family DNA-binding transcriptional regulator [Pseudomonadota bacterium]
MVRGPVTSGDVARLANVSQSAVSRAFTPGASVSATTRDRIMAAAEELGYRPNALARAMISGQSKIIALMFAYLENQFYPVLLEKLSRALQSRGYHTLLFMTEMGAQDDVVRRLLDYQVQGLVLASATLSSKLAVRCADQGIPVVLLNRDIDEAVASSVTSDNFLGGKLVAEHFVKTGRNRIAYIAGTKDSSTNRDREAGLHAGLVLAGRELTAHAFGNYNQVLAYDETVRLFSGPDRPDAVFVANDHMAFGVIDALRSQLGLRVPEDVAVVGYDDVPQAQWASYQLTTVRQPSDEMTDQTVRLLTDQIEGKHIEATKVLVPTQLIKRNTA